MSESPDQPNPDPPRRPVSAFADAVGALLKHGHLAPPPHPGLLARLDRFEIQRRIGVGRMGVVLLARDPQREALVVIKLLQPDLTTNPVAVRRFLREARIMQRLEHPHILKVLEVFDRREGPCFVMPYLERGSLAGLLEPGKPLAFEQTGELARQVADVLQHAHTKGVIHHDLKPGNVLLDAEGRAMLTDFGLARTLFLESFVDLDRGHCEGTAPYMSPALAAGQAEDMRCDIYAFGAVLYEMLAGQAPYEGKNAAEILQKMRDGPPPPISKLSPKVSPGLAMIAEGAMARELRDRYASMGDVAIDLERVRQGQPPLGPHGQWRAPRRWVALVRHHPRAAALALGAAVLAGLAGLATASLRPSLRVVHQFSVPEDANVGAAQIADWDGDKEPDLFIPQGRKCLVFDTSSNRVARFGPRDELATNVMPELVADVTGDGLDEVLLTWAGADSAHAAAFNRNQVAVFHVAVAGTTVLHPASDVPMYPRLALKRLLDLNHDGRNELLAVSATGFGPGPRALYCFDVAKEALLWQFDTAPCATDVAVADLDGDGADDILSGSQAVGNGRKLPDGTDDGRCYLYAVSSKGVLLWKRELGGIFLAGFPIVVSSPADQPPRLYAWFSRSYGESGKPGEEAVGGIVELDAQGRQKATYDAGAKVRSCLPAKLDGNSHTQILITDEAGWLLVLDLDLKPRRKVPVRSDRLGRVETTLLAVTNLCRGTNMHLVVNTFRVEHLRGNNVDNSRTNVNVECFHDHALEVWDSSLRPVTTFPLAKKLKHPPSEAFRLADWDHDGAQEILVLDRPVRVLKFGRGFF